MLDKIVPIGAHVRLPLDEDQPVDEIIELLEHTLEEARRGELRGVCLVGVTGGNNLVMRWHAQCNAGMMLGAATLLFEAIKGAFLENATLSSVDETPEPPDAA